MHNVITNADLFITQSLVVHWVMSFFPADYFATTDKMQEKFKRRQYIINRGIVGRRTDSWIFGINIRHICHVI